MATCWKRVGINSSSNVVPGEFMITTQDGVRLDLDGDKKGVFGDVSLTSHRLIWSKRSCDHDLNLSLSTVLLVEDEEGSLMSSDKINLTLIDPTTSQQSNCKLAFKQGGQKQFSGKLHEALAHRGWEVKIVRHVRKAPTAPRTGGVGGIQKSMEKKLQQTDSEISKAFQDINQLVEMAKPMVGLAKSISNKIKEKQSQQGGAGLNEDEETVQFKSYLMSLGIADPVTRDTHGSGQSYYQKLAKEIYTILEKPLQDNGGMMTLTDAFCRVNRARGMALLSPDDLIHACQTYASNSSASDLPIRLHTFPSTGVTVLQLSSAQVGSEEVVAKTEQMVEAGGMTAEEFARASGTALVIAKERLLAAENLGKLCRDDTIEGLRFYPNLILTQD